MKTETFYVVQWQASGGTEWEDGSSRPTLGEAAAARDKASSGPMAIEYTFRIIKREITTVDTVISEQQIP